MYSLESISVYIFNWKKVTTNSLKLYEQIKPIISNTTIINCDEKHPIDGSIQLNDSHYYGSQYDHAIKHVKPGNIFCVIVGDNIPNNNFEVIFQSALNAFNSHNVGVYAPQDKRSTHRKILSNYTGTLFNVENTDCGFWFIHPDIVSRLRSINYNRSKYGFYIDKLTIKFCIKQKMLVLRDYSISTDQLDHTCGYNRNAAAEYIKSIIEEFKLVK